MQMATSSPAPKEASSQTTQLSAQSTTQTLNAATITTSDAKVHPKVHAKVHPKVHAKVHPTDHATVDATVDAMVDTTVDATVDKTVDTTVDLVCPTCQSEPLSDEPVLSSKVSPEPPTSRDTHITFAKQKLHCNHGRIIIYLENQEHCRVMYRGQYRTSEVQLQEIRKNVGDTHFLEYTLKLSELNERFFK
jgi:hypothetical protein